MNKKTEYANIKKLILDYNRKPVLSPAFDKLLDSYIKSGKYMSVEKLQVLRNASNPIARNRIFWSESVQSVPFV